MPPRVLPRPQHTVSRKQIDADALKVLYRLRSHGYAAYLVGGGVRDLLLGRRPKDFDIGTDAHPQQVKKLFRNCFIIGRRFRLCHVRFGKNVVEVSTFRKQSEAEQGDTVVWRDNTFGTPEEDAFRRDFTVNALFYDIANFSVIDYVNGLEDLDKRVIRTIGDPVVRFREDPVRMLRAVSLASRLGFRIDQDTVEAIRFLRGDIVKASAARVLEEFYKVLRQGASRATFAMLHEIGLLAYLLPEADRALGEQSELLLGSLSRLDDYRNAGLATPDQLTNPLLLGTLLVPLGLPQERTTPRRSRGGEDEPEAEPADDVTAEMAVLGDAAEPLPEPATGGVPRLQALILPYARRDMDRLRLLLAAQRRLREIHSTPSVRKLLSGRMYLEEALRWLEIHGGVQGHELAEYWRGLGPEPVEEEPPPGELAPAAVPRKRRRRRRRSRPGPPAGETPA